MHFVEGLGPLRDWAGLARRSRQEKDEIDTEDESDLEEGFVSLCHHMHGEGQRYPISQQAVGVQSSRMLSRSAGLASPFGSLERG